MLNDDEVAELDEILAAVGEMRDRLSAKSRQFLEDVEQRYADYENDLRLSPAQWRWLRDMRSNA